MRGAAESDPYPLMLFVAVVYSFSHSSSDHSRKKNSTKHLFSARDSTTQNSIPLLCSPSSVFLSSPSLTHSVLHSHTHTVAVQKFFTLSRSHLPQISKESKFRSLSLSFSHTTCVDLGSRVRLCEFYVYVCVCVFVLAQRRNALLINQEEAEQYSHIFRTGKYTF